MTADEGKKPEGTPTTRAMAMRSHTNSAGDIFGGWVLSQMDIAAGIAAGERARGRVVTATIEAMTFIAPVKVGDVLSVYTRILKTGRTSITVAVEAWAHRNYSTESVLVTKGRFVFVALGPDGKKRPIPPVDGRAILQPTVPPAEVP